MLIGSCVVNSDGDFGYTVSEPFQDRESAKWSVKVIWVGSLIEAAEMNREYPSPLTVTNERESDIHSQ